MSTILDPTLVIEKKASLSKIFNFLELWNFRELIFILTWKDIKVRYKQAVLGIAWAFIQPTFTMITFSVLFGHIAKMPSDGLPYPLFSFAALLPWTYFSGALSRGTQSLVSSGGLLSKVYFPRVIIPLCAVLAGLVDYGISFVVLSLLMAFYGIAPGLVWFLATPALTLLVVAFAFAVSLWLSALNVRYRDVGHVIPFVLQIWMFATPVLYPLSLIPDKYRIFAEINPLAGVISGFRSLLLGEALDWHSISYGVVVTAILLVGGLIYFGKTERTFADVV